MNDAYGNYVLQRLYETSDKDIKREMYKFVYDNIPNLSNEGLHVKKFIDRFSAV